MLKVLTWFVIALLMLLASPSSCLQVTTLTSPTCKAAMYLFAQVRYQSTAPQD